MTRFDRLFLSSVIGFVPPILLSLLGWWTSLLFVPEERVYVFTLAGLFVGIALDLAFLRSWVRKGYTLSSLIQVLIYVFYSMGVFGFFMGLPVFNVLLGILAGVYTGRRLIVNKLGRDAGTRQVTKVSAFTSFILFVFCAASAYLALIDPYTAANLRGMFSLPFEVTRGMIYGLIIVGGIVLLAGQYWITKLTSLLVLRQGKYFLSQPT